MKENFGLILFIIGLIMVLVPIFRALFIIIEGLFNYNIWVAVAIIGIVFVIIGALIVDV